MTQAILPAPRGLIGKNSRTNKLQQNNSMSMTAAPSRRGSQMESQRMTAGVGVRRGIDDKMSITDYIQ